jgi:histidinol-phosphate/aromatic aminotransferase/cobyric acid decarboxylase-like protein
MPFENSPEKDRFISRLTTIPGIKPMPSAGDWILIQVDNPSDLARKVNRRLEPGTMRVPRLLQGAVRIDVAHPRDNERLFQTLRDVTQPDRRA